MFPMRRSSVAMARWASLKEARGTAIWPVRALRCGTAHQHAVMDDARVRIPHQVFGIFSRTSAFPSS